MALVVDLIVSALTVLLLACGLLMSPLHFGAPLRFHFKVLGWLHLLDLNFLLDGLGWENFLFLVAVTQLLSAGRVETTALGLFFVVVGLALLPFVALSFPLFGLLLTAELLDVLLDLFSLGLVAELLGFESLSQVFVHLGRSASRPRRKQLLDHLLRVNVHGLIFSFLDGVGAFG